MSTPTEPNMQIIENAHPDDVRPGDHITWERVEEFGGATIYERREGIACRRNPGGKWFTEAGVCLTDVVPHEAFTVTIRRPAVQELPAVPATVIVANDGHEAIEATGSVGGNKWRTKEAVLGADGMWHGVWREDAHPLNVAASVVPKHITPDTWKVDDQ